MSEAWRGLFDEADEVSGVARQLRSLASGFYRTHQEDLARELSDLSVALESSSENTRKLVGEWINGDLKSTEQATENMVRLALIKTMEIQ